ncbi:uncharacterized protein LOC141628340 [Silene latifolia]|uniref:uncharacterized protein LOC141628340 n=1 Tax=Silene latifolia TaxID=37657 RepID=UPI003D76A5B5
MDPLVEDLRILWDKGIEVFDAYQNSVFNLKAMLLCTISDFPAYGNLCGHTVHGKEACPLCGEDVYFCYLTFSRKQACLGYRRFLHEDHSYRRQQKAFNRKAKHRPPPKILTGHEVYEKVKSIQIIYGKKGSKLASHGYKKMSHLSEQLPYWRVLSIRHCLDVMHIEKNVCDNIINTLLNVPNKPKDNKVARKDMMEMKIRPELAPQEKGTRAYLPPAAHTLLKKEKMEFCQCLHGVKVPEGYSSNISNLVSMRDLKLTGLKSHDSHALMQQLLLVAIRSILPKKSRHSEWMMGKGLRGHVCQDMTTKKWHIAHTYVLHNEDESRVIQDLQEYPYAISSRLKRLCYGQDISASSYTGYAINGCTFYTHKQDDMSTMQNSGVCVEAEAMYFASSKDKNPILSKLHYYGVIEEIWELNYWEFEIPIFGCKWIEINNGVRKDELGFTLVNLGEVGHKEDPFILATQAKQVFYVTYPVDKNWSVVLSVRGRRAMDTCDEDVVFEGFD